MRERASGVWCRFLDRTERDLLLFRFGGDLLSHVLRRSTIGATALNCRDRDGIGCFARAMTTKPKKRQAASWRTRRYIRIRSGTPVIHHNAATSVLMVVFQPTSCSKSKLPKQRVAFDDLFRGHCNLYGHSAANSLRELQRPCCFWIKSSLSSN